MLPLGSRPPDDCPDCPPGSYCDECSFVISPVPDDPIAAIGCLAVCVFVAAMIVRELFW